jgi:hypothetical protein
VDSPQTFINVSDGETGDLGLYIGIGVGVFVLLLLIVVVALVVAQRRRKARQKDDIPDLSKVIDGRGSEYGSVAAIGTMSSVKPITNEYGSMAGIATVTELGAATSVMRTGTLPGRTSQYSSSSAIQPITYGSFPEGGTMS